MMTEDQTLDQLCGLFGIAVDYTDGRDERRQVPAKSKRALLVAMGLDLDDASDLQQVLQHCETRSWQRLLPPVLVVRQSAQAARILINLPAELTETQLNWTLVLENGERHYGYLRPHELETLAVYRDGQISRYGFSLPLAPNIGYHCFKLARPGQRPATMRLIVAPRRCYQAPLLTQGERLWGPAVQVYGLRSQRNWGIGDLSDLRSVLECSADLGAGVVSISPLHALFPLGTSGINPYCPSNRLFCNILYLDIEAIAEFAEYQSAQEAVSDPQFQARLRALRAGEQVDYAAVAEIKLAILERLYRQFRDQHLTSDSPRGQDFRAFQAEEAEALQHQTLFDALHEHFARGNPSLGSWTAWPEPYQDVASDQVTGFAAENRERLEFYAYLQWQLAQQLEAVNQRSSELKLGIGLCQDLAVSAGRNGAEVWSEQRLYADNISIGAPPDSFNPHGRNFGLAALNPVRLYEAAYAPFIKLLRKTMRYAGALRLDRFLGLARLFWIPDGARPAAGAYVDYPFEDLLNILALESQRHHCLVIGDDPTRLPEVARQSLAAYGILSRQVFYDAKRSDGEFQSPEEYPAQALVAISSSEQPTLNGYWQGTDLTLRDKLGLFPCQEIRDAQIVERAQDRARLRVALERQALLPADIDVHAISVPEMPPELIRSVHLYLGRSPAQLMTVRMEDVLAQVEQVCLPCSTAEQYPNWRYKLALNLEDWLNDPRLQALAAGLLTERSLSKGPPPAPAAERPLVKTRIPDATYRLQLNSDFPFAQATAIVPYLQALGISHCYASPYLRARPGSTHGYDIIDHNALNPEIGGREDFGRFSERLRRYGMRQILDVVPNHMGVMGSDNAWWLDVLENGPAAVHATFFDIDWQPIREELRGKVLLPVLGNHYGAVLENGELQLVFDAPSGSFRVQYYEHSFSIDPREYPRILSQRIEELQARMGTKDTHFLEYQSLTTAFGHLPERAEKSPEKVAERNRDNEIHKHHLAELCQRSPDIALFIEENVRLLNGSPGTPQSFDGLHALLEAQAYRLSFWRVASDNINYRRFFDINDLAGLRMEDEEVFRETHSLVLELLAEGKLDGLRIDHPDGLYNPKQYFQHLQEALVTKRGAGSQGENDDKPLYIVVEKILESYERLPENWPVHGTTGYDFTNLLNALLVDPRGEESLTRIYEDFLGESIDFEDLLYHCKKLIMRVSLASELTVLTNQLSRIAQADRHTRDFTLIGLWNALREIVACFPVYRTYITPEGVSDDDRRYIDWAVSVAKKRSQATDVNIFDFVREVLLTLAAEGKPPAFRERVIAFAMKFQQYTGPLMAKGLEDTAFYRYNRLISLNEVGGDPRRFAVSVSGFHYANQLRNQNWPHAMLSTSTHDSKRSEDVRARINVLSELSEEWDKGLKRWRRINKGKKRLVDDRAAPSANDEYLLYQTLLGAWPLHELNEARREDFRTRVENYMVKAVKEAKLHSSWINPDAAYEEAVINFVRALLDAEKNRFLDDFLPFQQRVARFGLYNSLSQTLLKLTCPGVPDIFQGNEIWDFSLVDPDNRRPVDYAHRRRLLRDLERLFSVRDSEVAPRAHDLLETMEDARPKLYLTWKTLSLRREQPDMFRDGDYTALTVTGAKADHVCAFARRSGEREAIVIAPRLFVSLLQGEAEAQPLGEAVWEDTGVECTGPAERHYVNVFTRETFIPSTREEVSSLALAQVLRHFPVALLVRN